MKQPIQNKPEVNRSSMAIRAEIARFRKERKPVLEIAKKLGLDRSTVYYHLRLMGLTTKQPTKPESHETLKPEKRLKKNHDSPDERISYWLRRCWK